MPTHHQTPQPLRLHRDEPDGSDHMIAPVYKFPDAAAGVPTGAVARAGSRRRLVAATVAQAPVEQCFDGSPCAVLNGGHDPDCLGRIVSSGQLIREIENTLDRMQDRLSDFRQEVDRAFRFPSQERGDDDLPPAA